uniref:DNA-directed RNA polymerase omega subunit n=1 Tax=Cyanidiococcus yangmingshanensis TaxID=2690220 RepID=A0A7G5VUY2_9RHOD|nr:DNA-directed RNA polymerase omega subunit [Cyanidiococcus yangmingshanensis]QMX77499.1 DNA-directed RNA polymerase omega subunit [Cyanidiococcus yangmingshanensis]UNJ15717.1 DNA-directed RNA polymerase omega subunit [Cyanidioschyzonaceae sp. 2]UNJ15903.1 DNA-directed RNA polymerase omega subunit [Cyanidioschyzonaceae sp. 3]WDB00408.1 DNA-directed RNA polymerase omega chain [Cyanidiococcus yangmingshanensis]
MKLLNQMELLLSTCINRYQLTREVAEYAKKTPSPNAVILAIWLMARKKE